MVAGSGVGSAAIRWSEGSRHNRAPVDVAAHSLEAIDFALFPDANLFGHSRIMVPDHNGELENEDAIPFGFCELFGFLLRDASGVISPSA